MTSDEPKILDQGGEGGKQTNATHDKGRLLRRPVTE